MNEWMNAFGSPDFYKGALLMGVLMLLMMGYAAYLRAESLYLSFKNESAIKLGKKFYYLVTEHEWNQVTLARLQRKAVEPVVEEGDGICILFTSRHGCRRYWADPSWAESVTHAKFFPNKAAAMLDHDKFRLLYALDRQCPIVVAVISEMETDEVARAKLLSLAAEQFAKDKEVEHVDS